MTANPQEHVLSGYKVLDFTQHIAGPTATRLLVEMGAEVIKVELAPGGEPSRYAPYIKGRSGTFIQQNRGKKSLCVDVKKPEGLAVLKNLLPKMDVLIENFAPGASARMGWNLGRRFSASTTEKFCRTMSVTPRSRSGSWKPAEFSGMRTPKTPAREATRTGFAGTTAMDASRLARSRGVPLHIETQLVLIYFFARTRRHACLTLTHREYSSTSKKPGAGIR